MNPESQPSREKVEALYQAIEQSDDPIMPKARENVRLTKISLSEEMPSGVQPGEKVEGMLVGEIRLGERMLVGTIRTTPVRAMRFENGKIIVETHTSVYELERVGH